jgi:hypothetical protein
MSTVSKSKAGIINYAMKRVKDTGLALVLYVRYGRNEIEDEYIATGEDSDTPTNTIRLGRFYKDGDNIVWRGVNS